ncbi:flagellar hook-basal body protein [Rummeliibacillus suwonensis]|jgi:fagellar hook-basal body proteins|uniref:flagellar hook-basal body protein n=1 Tax=Rummeliibacillus suwonensis TaxID=1306154 RepID=UPI0011B514C5|nr:flagellar hook-basal body protein [Rummeliibacillus suwonensis]MBO2535483.1 flagellar hook-basal body protein [Rummeliibacillus suwonensis]
MFRGFYTVASGMIAQQRRTELLSNNIANANTPGYKADQSTIRSFPEMLLSRITKSGPANVENGFEGSSSKQIGAVGTGVYMQETLPDYSQGQITETELPTDVALIDGNLPVNNATGKPGAIFYRLQDPTGGEAYTRNGNFTLDAAGNLVNAQGYYVLSDQGEKITLQSDDFQITEDGYITENGQRVARLGVSYSANPDTLAKRDTGLFYTSDEQPLPSAYNVNNVSFSLKQGFIERSNVDAARTMTDMMTAYRAFEANQKILQAYDRSMDKAVNEVGKV